MTEIPSRKKALRAVVVAAAVLLSVPMVVLAAPLIAASQLWDWFERRRLAREVAGRGQGRRLLLVYSDSPVWKTYIETNWLPRLADTAVVLNWSGRKRWPAEHAFEAQVFRRWAGATDFNPIAIAFMPDGRVNVVRFWRAFRDYKHGKPGRLRAGERQLEEIVASLRLSHA